MSVRGLSLAVFVGAFSCDRVAQRSMPEGLRPAPLFAFVYGAATKLAGLAMCVVGGSLVVAR